MVPRSVLCACIILLGMAERCVAEDPHEEADVTKKKLTEFRVTFRLSGKQLNLILDKDKLGELMQTLGLNAIQNNVKNAIAGVDDDESRGIKFDEFLHLIKLRASYTEADLRAMFNEIDTDSNGWVSVDELRHLLVKLGQTLRRLMKGGSGLTLPGRHFFQS